MGDVDIWSKIKYCVESCFKSPCVVAHEGDNFHVVIYNLSMVDSNMVNSFKRCIDKVHLSLYEIYFDEGEMSLILRRNRNGERNLPL